MERGLWRLRGVRRDVAQRRGLRGAWLRRGWLGGPLAAAVDRAGQAQPLGESRGLMVLRKGERFPDDRGSGVGW